MRRPVDEVRSVPELRMNPTEIKSGDKSESQIGSSKLAGVQTKIFAGNPAAAGFYSILLFVPPRTTIQALIRTVTTAWRASCPGPGTLDMERILTRRL
jgi:hypothetical protein